MFGGADPSVPNLVPADIVISHNLVSKRLTWRTSSPWRGAGTDGLDLGAPPLTAIR